MMKRITKISLIGVATLIIITTISACNHYKSPENRAEWMMDKVTDKLELTDIQQNKLKALSKEMLSIRKAMKPKFVDSREQLVALFEQPILDQNKTLSFVQSKTQMIEEKAPVLITAFANFYDSLDVEQQSKVRDFVQKHKERSHHRSHVFFKNH